MSIIRSMMAEDAAKVASLEAEIFSQPWSENAFLDSLRLPDTIFLVAEESGVIQGYIGMYLAADEGEIRRNDAAAPPFSDGGYAALQRQQSAD